MTPKIPLIAGLFAAALVSTCVAQEPAFALHDGDRVVFYGDSITQAGGYGHLVEVYTRCHFPKWDIRFYNSGVGGDRVTGGWAGKDDIRVQRDVIALKPTVVTIMLGMNDGRYRPLTKATMDGFTQGYRSIIDRIKAALPGVRIYLIRTSPFDDITRSPQFGNGYDEVLQKMGDAVAAIGVDEHLEVVDFGKAVDDGLRAVWAENKDLAKQLLPDRVHPNPSGHTVMGATLLRAWHAPSVVTHVQIDALAGKALSAENATVSEVVASSGTLTWKETDSSLPLPVNFDNSDTFLAEKAGADLEAIDSEALVVTGLKAGAYHLMIGDSDIGTFAADQLASGINLARYNTPMRSEGNSVGWSSEDSLQAQLTRRQMFRATGSPVKGGAETADLLLAYDEALQAARSSNILLPERVFTLSPITP
jgi:lysophospholipase L1-like esterase